MNAGLTPYQEKCKSVDCGSESIVDMLKQKQLRLQSQLDETNEALRALEKNPEVTKLLHLVTKASRF